VIKQSFNSKQSTSKESWQRLTKNLHFERLQSNNFRYVVFIQFFRNEKLQKFYLNIISLTKVATFCNNKCLNRFHTIWSRFRFSTSKQLIINSKPNLWAHIWFKKKLIRQEFSWIYFLLSFRQLTLFYKEYDIFVIPCTF